MDSLPIATPEPIVVPEDAPPAAGSVAWPTNWVSAWVPLESWGQFNRLDRPVQVKGGWDSVYRLETTSGPLRVQMGQQTASLGGLGYLLGFKPRAINGVPYLHSLDLQKTLQLLLGPPWTPNDRPRVIVLDPGHGGRDNGAQNGATLECEKHFALDWALRLRSLLAARGWKVVLTRSNDTFVALPDRVAIAERTGASLFLSLHFNSGHPNPERAGIETYCLTPPGMPSHLVRDYEDDPREVHPNNAFDAENFRLAARVHRELVLVTGASDGGVRRARFMTVLQGQNRPAVLIEGGYLSNPAEARRIATPEYRQLLAQAVARALE
jgi:N-acetylmuramoyl-L-alanine amidase